MTVSRRTFIAGLVAAPLVRFLPAPVKDAKFTIGGGSYVVGDAELCLAHMYYQHGSRFLRLGVLENETIVEAWPTNFRRGTIYADAGDQIEARIETEGWFAIRSNHQLEIEEDRGLNDVNV